MDSRLRGNDILAGRSDDHNSSLPKTRPERGGLMRTRVADCLTEPGIVCPIVAGRLASA